MIHKIYQIQTKKQVKTKLFSLFSFRYHVRNGEIFQRHLNESHARDFYTLFYERTFTLSNDKLACGLVDLKIKRNGDNALKLLEKLIVFRKHYQYVFPGMRFLAQSMGLSLAAVSRAIKLLINAGLIQVGRFNRLHSYHYKLARSLFDPALKPLLSQYLSKSILIDFSMLLSSYGSLISSKWNRIKIRSKDLNLLCINCTTPEVVQVINETLDKFWSVDSRKKIAHPIAYLRAMLCAAIENYSWELSVPILVSQIQQGIIAMNPLKAYTAMHSRVSGTPQRQTPPPVAPAPPRSLAEMTDIANSTIKDRGLRDAMLNFLAKCASVSPKQGDTHEEDIRHQHTTYSMEESRKMRQAIL